MKIEGRIDYREKNKAYEVRVKNQGKWKSFSYSLEKHGPFALPLAKLTLETKERHEHIVEEKEGYLIINKYVNSLQEIKQFKIDIEDYDKVKEYHWSYWNGYAYNAKIGFLHRYILDLPKTPNNHQDYVDHINRDKSDNRKNNLRVVDNSHNQRNKGRQSNNSSGIRGVKYQKKDQGWAAQINNYGKRYTKFFSEKVYGEEAKSKAIEWRKSMEKQMNYLSEKSSTTIETDLNS